MAMSSSDVTTHSPATPRRFAKNRRQAREGTPGATGLMSLAVQRKVTHLFLWDRLSSRSGSLGHRLTGWKAGPTDLVSLRACDFALYC